MWIGILYVLGIAGFLGYLPGAPRELRFLVLLFVVPLVISFLRSFLVHDKEQPTKQENLPLPPASGGIFLFLLRVYLCQILSIFIPTMWPQLVRQTIGNARAAWRVVDHADKYTQKTRYILPFSSAPEGADWYVYNGGVTAKTSHSWGIVGQRYAYDFVVIDQEGRRWRTDGHAKEDYLCYGLPILAPADGEVVAVIDSVRDAPAVGSGWIDVLTPHFPGCTITLRHAEGEYSLLAHLQPGSMLVWVGDQVRQGQPIARCGHSGHSTEPHLHFQIQDRADFFRSASLPVRFTDLTVDGQGSETDLYLTRGQRVSSRVYTAVEQPQSDGSSAYPLLTS